MRMHVHCARSLRSLAGGAPRPPPPPHGKRLRAKRAATHQHSIPKASCMCNAMYASSAHHTMHQHVGEHQRAKAFRPGRPGHAWHVTAPMQRGMDITGSACSRAACMTLRKATGNSAQGARWSMGRAFARWKCAILTFSFPHSGRALSARLIWAVTKH